MEGAGTVHRRQGQSNVSLPIWRMSMPVRQGMNIRLDHKRRKTDSDDNILVLGPFLVFIEILQRLEYVVDGVKSR